MQATDFESEYFAEAGRVLAVDKNVVNISLQFPVIVDHEQSVNVPPCVLRQLPVLVHQLPHNTTVQHFLYMKLHLQL